MNVPLDAEVRIVLNPEVGRPLSVSPLLETVPLLDGAWHRRWTVDDNDDDEAPTNA